ncbi:MAG: FAD-dependent oxidoreductase [Candidatus Neomarinimicrobiota bacterium]
MKIAIIGSGISGLTCAYMLNRKHDITIFEKNDYIGGHTHTHEIEYSGRKWNIDSGFIVYNERTYPNFINILDRLGVERQLTRMGFSVKSEKNDLEYAGHSLNGLFAQRSNLFRPSFIRMLRSMWRFNSEARSDLKGLDSETTLGEYLKSNGYPEEFIQHFIIPIGAAIWSTVPNQMMDMPAIFFIRFFENHGMLQIVDRPNWWVITGGSKRYVEKMVDGFENKIRLSSPVKNVKREDGSITVQFGANSLESENFDSVIFATHSNQSLAMLDAPTKAEIEILSAIKYQKNDALLHYDDSILPKRKNAWSSWNYLLDEDQSKAVALTYNMNILQSLKSDRTFCVSLNSGNLVDESKVIKELSYDHPLFTTSSINAQSRKHEISGKNNTYYCGAYWRNGFHEDGVMSALDVCKDFGESL